MNVEVKIVCIQVLYSCRSWNSHNINFGILRQSSTQSIFFPSQFFTTQSNPSHTATRMRSHGNPYSFTFTSHHKTGKLMWQKRWKTIRETFLSTGRRRNPSAALWKGPNEHRFYIVFLGRWGKLRLRTSEERKYKRKRTFLSASFVTRVTPLHKRNIFSVTNAKANQPRKKWGSSLSQTALVPEHWCDGGREKKTIHIKCPTDFNCNSFAEMEWAVTGGKEARSFALECWCRFASRRRLLPPWRCWIECRPLRRGIYRENEHQFGKLIFSFINIQTTMETIKNGKDYSHL